VLAGPGLFSNFDARMMRERGTKGREVISSAEMPHLQDFERGAFHSVAVVKELLLPLGGNKVAQTLSLA
jgi:hypothetical protein